MIVDYQLRTDICNNRDSAADQRVLPHSLLTAACTRIIFQVLDSSGSTMVRLPIRFSFIPLLLGVVFGFCLVSLVNQSLQL